MTTLIFPNTTNFIQGVPGISVFGYSDSIKEDLEIKERKERKLSQLKANIGINLYEELSDEQRDFIAGISGVINLGNNVNINAIYNAIENIDYE